MPGVESLAVHRHDADVFFLFGQPDAPQHQLLARPGDLQPEHASAVHQLVIQYPHRRLPPRHDRRLHTACPAVAFHAGDAPQVHTVRHRLAEEPGQPRVIRALAGDPPGLRLHARPVQQVDQVAGRRPVLIRPGPEEACHEQHHGGGPCRRGQPPPVRAAKGVQERQDRGQAQRREERQDRRRGDPQEGVHQVHDGRGEQQAARRHDELHAGHAGLATIVRRTGDQVAEHGQPEDGRPQEDVAGQWRRECREHRHGHRRQEGAQRQARGTEPGPQQQERTWHQRQHDRHHGKTVGPFPVERPPDHGPRLGMDGGGQAPDRERRTGGSGRSQQETTQPRQNAQPPDPARPTAADRHQPREDHQEQRQRDGPTRCVMHQPGTRHVEVDGVRRPRVGQVRCAQARCHGHGVLPVVLECCRRKPSWRIQRLVVRLRTLAVGEVQPGHTPSVEDRQVRVVRQVAVDLLEERRRQRPPHRRRQLPHHPPALRPRLEHERWPTVTAGLEVHDHRHRVHPRALLGEGAGAVQALLLGIGDEDQHVVSQCAPGLQHPHRLKHHRHTLGIIGRRGAQRHTIVMRHEHHHPGRVRPGQPTHHVPNQRTVHHPPATHHQGRRLRVHPEPQRRQPAQHVRPRPVVRRRPHRPRRRSHGLHVRHGTTRRKDRVRRCRRQRIRRPVQRHTRTRQRQHRQQRQRPGPTLQWMPHRAPSPLPGITSPVSGRIGATSRARARGTGQAEMPPCARYKRAR